MGYAKLAKDIYKLALDVENGTNEDAGSVAFELQARKAAAQKAATKMVDASAIKTADRMVQFQDDAGNSFILPFAEVGNATWAYSPFDRSRAKRQGYLNVQMSGKMEDAFGPTANVKEAAIKTADRMVQFKDEGGHTFLLPYESVGTARWAYSPYDRSRAQRSGMINLQMTGKLEEAFGV